MLSPGSFLNYELGTPGTSASAFGTSDRIDVTGDLTLDGTLNLAQSGDAGDGTAGLGYYRIMTYGGTLVDNGLTVGAKPSLAEPGEFVILTDVSNVVDLFIKPVGDTGGGDTGGSNNTLQHWQGGNGTWNATNTKWFNIGSTVPVSWAGNHAVFKNEPGGFSGGTISVEGKQSFHGLQFVDEGYRLEGTGSLETVAGSSEIRVLADRAEIATAISGTGGITKTEAGTLILSGDSSGFAGSTLIKAGTLLVGKQGGNGKLGGSLSVLTGATLGGSGTVGSGAGLSLVTVASGGTLSPGDGIGTLTVDGDLRFEPGSRFIVEVNPDGTDSDMVLVTGNATLNGGAVAHIGAGGNYRLRSTYTILSADGTLSGAFEGVSSDFAFLTPDLIYDYGAGTVNLELARNDIDFASVSQTPNQIATAGGIESIGLDAAHPVYDAIAQLPNDGNLIRASFDALSGEIHGSSKTALIQDSRFIRNATNDRMRAAFATAGASSAPVLAFAPGLTPIAVTADHAGAAFWSHGFGSWGLTDSDGNAASFNRNTGGLLIGTDTFVGDWRIGILAGVSHSSFKVNDRASSGSSDNYHLGLYGGTQWGNLALRTGAAYSWHNIDTSRAVSIPGLSENLSASYRARTFQAFGELAYGFDIDTATRIEPFANLAHVRLHSNGFTERGGAAALSGASGSTNMTFTTLGLRAEHKLALGTGNATLHGLVGWRHAFGDITPVSTHAFSAGNAFTIAGVPIARNSAVIEAGLDFNLTPNSTFSLSYAGQLASGARDHAIKANFAMRF